MPVEIKELNIKIALDNSDNAGTTTAQTEAANGNYSAQPGALVEIVVEKVLEILKNRTER